MAGHSFRKLIWAVGLLLWVVLLGGCGYVLQGGGTALPLDVRRIYIPVVENNSSQPGLTMVMTEALRDRFERFGAVTVVDSLGAADAVLRSKIVEVTQASRTSSSRSDNVVQYDTTVTVAAELVRVGGQLLWSNPRILVSGASAAAQGGIVTSSSAFASTGLTQADLRSLGSREISRSSQQQLFELMGEEIARRIYDEAVAPDF